MKAWCDGATSAQSDRRDGDTSHQPLFIGPPLARRLAHFGRGGAIAPAKRAVEIGEVAEPGLEGDGRNGPSAVQRVGQHPVRAHKSLPKEEFRKSCAFVLEQ